MKNRQKFDDLMHDVSKGKLTDRSDDLIARMEVILQEEEMGTLDEMMDDIREYLSSKDKLDTYVNEQGVMQLPLEMVFSWFSNAIFKTKMTE
jgi:tetrahydromethanopterin S-methyltransferase subunit B